MKNKPEILKTIALNVRKERLSKNLSQEELADLAQVHRTYIGMIERAEKNITVGNLQKISIALNVNIKSLFDAS